MPLLNLSPTAVAIHPQTGMLYKLRRKTSSHSFYYLVSLPRLLPLNLLTSTYSTTTTMASSAEGNRLRFEKSPYLLQHANNPINWYPYGPEAIAAAKAQDKMIFLSVGYATCHWCHVMEKESFESHEVAQIVRIHDNNHSHTTGSHN